MDATASWWQVDHIIRVTAQLIEVLKYEYCLCFCESLGSPSVCDVTASRSLPGQTNFQQGTGQLSYDPCNQVANHFILPPGENKHLIKTPVQWLIACIYPK